MTAELTMILVDADNTLWNTDAIFAKAQVALFDTVHRLLGSCAVVPNALSYVRALDQAIADTHQLRLRYPPRLLVEALVQALRTSSMASNGLRPPEAIVSGQLLQPQDEIDRLEVQFAQDLRQAVPDLRDGVREGLMELVKRGGTITVVTEGARERVLKTLRHHEIDQVTRVLETQKTRDTFAAMLRQCRSALVPFMVGDQLAADIRPAKQAGFRTIYFPGGFQPRWEADESNVHADFSIESFTEVPDIVFGRA